MSKNPYLDLPPSAFWKTGVANENPFKINQIYEKKFNITPATRIATAGSCFAQHITRHLRRSGFNVLDVEPPPPGLPQNMHHGHGFSMYSARYGNIYSVSQLLQLAKEAAGEWSPQDFIWEKSGRYFDALRPSVEPDGLDSAKDVIEHRKSHIARVKDLFVKLDLFIFTLGLTEMWVHRDSGTVYPAAPGSVAGAYDEHSYCFKNAKFAEVISEFNEFQRTMKTIRNGRCFNILLTVSPVPLTASASGKHVLVSTSYSKSILRAAAGQLSSNQSHVDYFPSYELINNPRLHSTAFSENLRTVRDESVDNVMSHFLAVHNEKARSDVPSIAHLSHEATEETIQCEEALSEQFAR